MKDKIILMSAGSLVGYNIINCLENRRKALSIIATNTVANEPSIFDCDKIYLVPPTRSNKFQDVFLKIIEKEKPLIIIPCRDEDVFALARMKEKISSNTQTACLCGTPDIAKTLLQKDKSHEFACTHGLPFAATLNLPASSNELSDFLDRHDFPLVVKPKRGFASQGISLLTDKTHLNEFQGQSNIILQEFIGDTERIEQYNTTIKSKGLPLFNSFESVRSSIQIFISKEGALLSTFVTAHKMVMGKSEKVWRVDDLHLEQFGIKCGKIFAAEGWRGPLNLNCQHNKSGEIIIFEFNGRLTGATHARFLLGYDEVALALQDFASIPIKPRVAAQGQEVVRYPEGKMLKSSDLEYLESHGFWHKF